MHNLRDTRIQKVLAELGICSRRAAEKLIEQGRVKLNGRPVSLGDKMDERKDLLSLDDKNIIIPKRQELVYYMLHKPRGYVTTASDELGRKTVMEFFKDLSVRVYPVGRLDKDSEGLLLFTNDGEFTNLLTHPSHEVSKLYRVTVTPKASEAQLVDLTNGVTLDDGTKTLPCVIHVVVDEPGRTVLEITIKEGKNRQIRRMCEAVGLSVSRLRRSAVGPLKLGMLKPGTYRELLPKEIVALRASAAKSGAAKRQQKAIEAKKLQPKRSYAPKNGAKRPTTAAKRNAKPAR